MEETTVIIVGAGPAGMAAAACLNRLEIPNIVLEREDCSASLWKKKAYDRLKLHLAREFCELPYMSYPPNTPRFIPKRSFIGYLDDYAARFGIHPRCHRFVELACYDEKSGAWRVHVRNACTGMHEEYVGQFLVVATGENSEGFVPDIPGLKGFSGEFLHSSEYVNGKPFKNKDVLVVGGGNSGMEIAYDLSNYDARTSIVVRGPIHILTKEIVWLSMFLLKYLSFKVVDTIAVALGRLTHGNLAKYGFKRPEKGPFVLKATTGRSATIDVGTVKKIKKNQIKVFPSIKSIEGKHIKFIDEDVREFDAIVFATGYKSTVRKWLKDGEGLFDANGLPIQGFPNHWKGGNGIYCTGFAKQGLMGISIDAKKIAEDINNILKKNKQNN